MEKRELFGLLVRYAFLLVLGVFIWLIYSIVTPITIHLSYLLINLFFDSSIVGNVILAEGIKFIIISPCVAGAAYYLILILNLSTPMPASKRAKSLAFALIGFLILNSIRILAFVALAINQFQYFDLAHKWTWYIGSTILIVLIWFLSAWIFNIESIPFYSDIKNIAQDIK
jgi:exosortase/archaeosortase family protein